jgi:hypothetical protein
VTTTRLDSKVRTMLSLDELPEIRTDLFSDGESRGADSALQVLDPSDGCSVVDTHAVGFPA